MLLRTIFYNLLTCSNGNFRYKGNSSGRLCKRIKVCLSTLLTIYIGHALNALYYFHQNIADERDINWRSLIRVSTIKKEKENVL